MTDWRNALAKTLGSNHDLFTAIIRSIHDGGGRGLIVGGWVRDFLRRAPAENVDVEVYGIAPVDLRALLESHGQVDDIGEAFGILKLRRLDVDFSIPRRENKAGLGHRGFEILSDPDMTPQEAARRRDLTINSIALNVDTGEVIDPFNGAADIDAGVLRATDPGHFAEDPLRVYRTAQFAARLCYEPTPELVGLCSAMSPEDLPPERILAEFDKLLLKGRRPSRGLSFLRDCGWITWHPELEALIDCEQDDQWHPEGDVWNHTLYVLDAAARERTGVRDDDRLVMYAALCHDLGKPATTAVREGRIRSIGHSREGEGPTREFLGRMTRQKAFIDGVVKLVVNHLAPSFLHDGAKDGAIRRLAGRLEPEVSIDLLLRVSRADNRGVSRLGGGGGGKGLRACDWLLERARKLAVQDAAPKPLVMGKHLKELGLEPGPQFGPILKSCYNAQLDGKFSTVEEGIEYAGTLA